MTCTKCSFRSFIKHAHGTYACYNVHEDHAQLIYNWFTGQLTEALKQPTDYHVTLVYSRTPFPQIEEFVSSMKDDIYVKPVGLDYFGESRDVIVMKVESDDLQAYHASFLDMGMEYDWPKYEPHITLYSHAEGIDISKLRLSDLGLDEIRLSNLTIEGLETDD